MSNRTAKLTHDELLELYRWWDQRRQLGTLKTKAAEYGIAIQSLGYRLKKAKQRFGKTA